MSESLSNAEGITQPHLLNPATLPFLGSSLIEASAGTGKTYTISGLYLRLLLGDGIPRPLSCEQILVVTFTNAATEELRDRIRNRIKTAFKCFLGLPTQDAFVQALYEATAIDERAAALRRFDFALKSLDEAAIFTIHGFCQRILSDMAFESSLLFESEFTLDDQEYLHHSVRDFWRETCYPLNPVLGQIIFDAFGGPDALQTQLRPLVGANDASPQVMPTAFTELASQLMQNLTRLKLIWPNEKETLLAYLHKLPLNGQRYGKASDGYPKLAALFDSMDNWLRSGQGLPPAKVLEQLSLSELKLNKGGVLPTADEAPLLAHIERLNMLVTDLIPSFLYSARSGIAQRFAKLKADRNILTPDDLLTTLASAIQANGHLSSAIAKRFPIALIDEFQDTDPLQFAIFSGIYQQTPSIKQKMPTQSNTSSPDTGLLMIGDPKQAIYAFRGADIHTYLQAREQTRDHYHLGTNYRSSHQLVTAINAVFQHSADPFISQAIPFEAVNTPESAKHKVITEASPNSAALRIKLLSELPQQGLNKATARALLAADAAAEIKRLLMESQNGQCLIEGRALIAKDIAVLVRDRNEAAMIKQALSVRKIGSVFLSRDSVFDTIEARELVLILRSLANPKDERALRSALATALLGYSADEIHRFNQDDDQRQLKLMQFFQLHHLWLKRGIMPALLSLANDTQLIERLLQGNDGERRLTDFRHLAELLQQKATELDGMSALLNWFEQQLVDNSGTDEQQLRLESEQNLVQIVTIHKSKGLEYPVCFVPFVSLARDNRRRPMPMLYHDNNHLIWDIKQTDEGWDKHKQETLAEDLRLLYVALTRPVYLCYLSVANHSRFSKNAGLSSQLFETAIGYLLGITDKQCDFALITQQAHALSATAPDAISVNTICDDIDTSPLMDNLSLIEPCFAKPLDRDMDIPWRVGSYSGLVKQLAHEKVQPGAGDEGQDEPSLATTDILNTIAAASTEADANALTLSRFTFERGANAGSFMHLVLELIDFTRPEIELAQHLPKAMDQYGIDPVWLAPLTHWYLDVLHSPLNQRGLCLSQLNSQQKLVEMEFYLPLNRLKAQSLNRLLAQYGYGDNLAFDDLQGMLKGFIDLTFEYQGQFYIADYKSNHLGDEFSEYRKATMQTAMLSHRYDLQYILYSLALHRYLAVRLANYDYDTHIGGCYYLFLRGMSPAHRGAGIFFDKPPKALIEALDRLFSGDSDESAVITTADSGAQR